MYILYRISYSSGYPGDDGPPYKTAIARFSSEELAEAYVNECVLRVDDNHRTIFKRSSPLYASGYEIEKEDELTLDPVANFPVRKEYLVTIPTVHDTMKILCRTKKDAEEESARYLHSSIIERNT